VFAGYPAQRSSHSSGVGGGDSQGLPQQRLLAERKWRLGLTVRGHPSALMAELYRVLQVRPAAACLCDKPSLMYLWGVGSVSYV
jgi:5'-AMP-activated protein kinase catalytic alpha subunit